MIRVLALLVLLCSLVACSSDELKVARSEVSGAGTLGLVAKGASGKGVIIYFHGADQTADVIWTSERHRNLFTPLLRAGYAVVAADADGNAFGNPASRQVYRQLMAAARTKYSSAPVYFVAESMGALPALALLSEDSQKVVKGLVGISPLMGIPPQYRAVSFVADMWGGHVTDSADPMSWPPQAFAGRSFQLFASDTDNVVPPGATAQDFANRFGTVASISVIACQGGHVASDCYRGNDVEQWLATTG
jgi:predicted alpha/beta hydrolase family esterase